MAEGEVALSIAGLIGYLAVAYVIGRLLVGVFVPYPSSLLRITSPLLGGSALGIVLWIYGAVHIPWNPLTLLLPWFGAAIVRRKHLLRAFREDWQGVATEIRFLSQLGPLELVLAVATVVMGAVYLLNLVTQPVLGWDAIAMWLFKANLYYTQQAVDLGPISTDIRRNLDYPPLYSLMVASMYTITGHLDDILGKSVTYLFFLTSVLGFLTEVRGFLGRQLALTFTFLVAAMPIFLPAVFSFPYMGWADYPVAALMLVSLLHLLHGNRTGDPASFSFAIVFAALAALTKNEGLSFLAVVLIVLAAPSVVTSIKRRKVIVPSLPLIAVVVLALAPLIAWQLYLKLNAIQSAQVVGEQSVHDLLLQLPGKALAAVRAIRAQLSFQSDYPWIASAYILSLGLSALSRSVLALPVVAIVSLQATSYLIVYLITPLDINYLVSVTFDRLMLQLAPSIVLLLAIAIVPYLATSSDKPDRPGQKSRPTPAVGRSLVGGELSR